MQWSQAFAEMMPTCMREWGMPSRPPSHLRIPYNSPSFLIIMLLGTAFGICQHISWRVYVKCLVKVSVFLCICGDSNTEIATFFCGYLCTYDGLISIQCFHTSSSMVCNGCLSHITSLICGQLDGTREGQD